MVAVLVSDGGKNCGNGAGYAPYPATGFDSSSPPPPTQAGFGATSTSGSRADPPIVTIGTIRGYYRLGFEAVEPTLDSLRR